ncbi:hypothetical protein ES708_14263 [subsurface metagenome]
MIVTKEELNKVQATFQLLYKLNIDTLQYISELNELFFDVLTKFNQEKTFSKFHNQSKNGDDHNDNPPPHAQTE